MNYLIIALTLSLNLISTTDNGLDMKQLIGNRIPFVVEPQSQFLYSVAVNTAEGDYFLPWTKSDHRVYGRLYGPHGGKMAPLQSFKGGSIPGQPRRDGSALVVFNSIDRRYLVVWHSAFGDPRYDPVARERRGQFVSSSGQSIGTSWIISRENIRIQKLLHNSRTNHYALFYWAADSHLDPRVLYLQRLDAKGQPYKAPRRLNSPTSGNSTDLSDIAYDPVRNQYLVVWESGGGLPSLVRYRTVSADLKTLGTIHVVEAGPSTSANPVVVYDSHKKRFIIVWHNGGKLKMRGISTYGTPQTNVVSFNISNLISHYFTAAINSSSGSILIGYFIAPGGKTKLLFLQRMDSDFLPMGDPFLGSSQDARILSADIFLQYNPIAEEFMSIWSYLDRYPNSLDIYGQRVRGVPLSIK